MTHVDAAQADDWAMPMGLYHTSNSFSAHKPVVRLSVRTPHVHWLYAAALGIWHAADILGAVLAIERGE